MKYITLIIVLALLSASCNDSDKKEKDQIKIGKNYSNTTPQTDLEKSINRGKVVYKEFCNQCHRPNGKGVGRSFPPLAGSDYLMENREASIRGVKFGQKGEIVVNGKTYNGVMLPMGLTDEEVADVMNYVMNSWGNEQNTMVTEGEVAEIKEQP